MFVQDYIIILESIEYEPIQNHDQFLIVLGFWILSYSIQSRMTISEYATHWSFSIQQCRPRSPLFKPPMTHDQ